MSRIIITGASGFIGRHLVKALVSKKEHNVALLSNTTSLHDKYLPQESSQKHMPLTFYIADIRDRESILKILLNERPDICIHLAAKTGLAESIGKTGEIADINVRGTLNVLEACHSTHVGSFVFASSAAVYGNVQDLPIKEDNSLRPLSAYGTSKMLAEQHVASYQSSKKIHNAVLLRIFSAYGTSPSSERDVITRFASELSRGLSPLIYGNGSQTRDFVSVDDVVEAILLSIRAMEEAENDNSTLPLVYNIGTGTPTSISHLAQKMICLFGLELEPVYKEGQEETGVIKHSYADTTRAKEFLHFIAKKGIDAGLNEIVAQMDHSVTKQ